jgi:hypothetical protein
MALHMDETSAVRAILFHNYRQFSCCADQRGHRGVAGDAGGGAQNIGGSCSGNAAAQYTSPHRGARGLDIYQTSRTFQDRCIVESGTDVIKTEEQMLLAQQCVAT